jgi:hypothetical protein
MIARCPNARAAARELILLPTYPGYPATEIQKNIDVIQNFLDCKWSDDTGSVTDRHPTQSPKGLSI